MEGYAQMHTYAPPHTHLVHAHASEKTESTFICLFHKYIFRYLSLPYITQMDSESSILLWGNSMEFAGVMIPIY